MKTYKEWVDKNCLLYKYVSPGDEIDFSLYNYILNIVPPAALKSYGFLCGETSDFDNDMKFLYQSFYISPSLRYFYGGLKTIDEFIDCFGWEYILRHCCNDCKGSQRPGWILDKQWTKCKCNNF